MGLAFRVTMICILMAGFVNSFTVPLLRNSRHNNVYVITPTELHMTALKPAAMQLMDSGKAFARSGEFLIDLTSQIDLYGGALSQVGALIRNSGDCIAQAAASARFKTGLELVIDELRESATCLTEATLKLKLAVKESAADKNDELARLVGESIEPMDQLAIAMEEAGKSILQRKPVNDVGASLIKCGDYMETLSIQLKGYAPKLQEASDAGQRMAVAAERMREAGYQLTGAIPETNKPKGKGWIKG